MVNPTTEFLAGKRNLVRLCTSARQTHKSHGAIPDVQQEVGHFALCHFHVILTIFMPRTLTNSSYRFHLTDFTLGQLHRQTFVVKSYKKRLHFQITFAMANYDVTP